MKNHGLDRETPVPLHYQIRKSLESQIKKGKLPVGERLPAERELMDMYKVSRATIRKALDDLTVMGLLQRTTGKGTFVAGKGRELVFAVLLPSAKMTSDVSFLYHFIYYDLIRGISEACKDLHVRMQLFHILNDDEGCKKGKLELERFGNIDGVIFTGYTGYEPLLKYVIECGIPRALVTHETDPPETSRIRSASYKGACELMEYLISLGHRRIGLIYHSDSKLIRYKAYKDTLEKNNIPFDPELMEGTEVEKDIDIGTSLLSLKKPPTAVFASNDIIAMKLASALHAKGIRIPQDISIAGFDDMPGAKDCSPPLTTVKVDSEKIGYEAVKVLKLWNESENYKPLLHLMETKLIIRDSCAPVSAD